MIRLYGHMKGSFRTVTLGLERAFMALEVLEGTHLGENVEFEDGVGGAGAPVAVVTGDPMRILQAHYQGSHKEIWLMLAPNSEGIPPLIKQELSDSVRNPATGERRPAITGLLAPSSWAKKILQREFPRHPVILCRHGVLPEFKPDPNLRKMAKCMFAAGEFRVLHVTSSRLSRKCTRETILAWKQLHSRYPKSKLEVFVNPEFVSEYVDLVQRLEAGGTTTIVPGQNYLLDVFANGIQAYAFVVQPSRAEGFGLVPLEARACGVPVVATDNTGHRDHVKGEGTIVVPSEAEMPSDDFPGARAPSVSVEAIFRGMQRMVDRFEIENDAASRVAVELGKYWSWEKQVASAVQELKERVNA